MYFRKYLIKFVTMSLLIMFIITSLPMKAEANSVTYTVYNLSLENKKVVFGDPVGEYTSFAEAKKKMLEHKDGVITASNSRSPLKIVAATRAQAQSYPYRASPPIRNDEDKATVTLIIYKNKSLSNSATYIPAHYMMYVYDFEEYNGRIIADVEIQGGRGYVDVVKTDIIPMIYIEAGDYIKIGGNEDYYKTKEQPYDIVPVQETYTVNKDGELRVRVVRPNTKVSDRDFTLTYGIAPKELKPETNYYSPDGINFYSDRDLKNKVVGDYYAYFQWLPVRSMTNYYNGELETYLSKAIGDKTSVMTGATYNFIEQGLKWGMNPLLIFQQANLESGHGTSKYALERYNLFGWGAVDSDPDQAQRYKGVGLAVEKHMKDQISGYFDISNWRHEGASFGNKGAGITVRYASDPYYGIKIASLAYRLDKQNGRKDHNAYNLSLLKDNTSYPVYKESSGNAEWYKTKSGLKYQVIVNLGKENNRIKTTLMMPNYKGVTQPKGYPMNLFEEFGFINESGIKNIAQHGPKGTLPKAPENWTPPAEQELKYQKPAHATTTANLNLRKSFSTSSQILTTIPKGTKIVVEATDIGWARTSYNGHVGFVSMDYLNIGAPVGDSEYKKGDVNGDGTIDGFDMMEIKRHYLGIKKLKGEQLQAADTNKDGVVDGFDMMDIKRHYLGIKLIKE